MKTVAAILCGVLLAWAQLNAGQPVLNAAPATSRHCCHCGGKMACCSGRQSSPAPASAAVTRSVPANEVLLPPPAVSLLVSSISLSDSVPAIAVIRNPSASLIYARDCARLI